MEADMDATQTSPRDVGSAGSGAQPALGALFSRLFRQSVALVQEEVELAKAEVGEKASLAASGATRLAIGAAVAYAGFLALLVAMANGLVLVLPPEHAIWLAPLIVGVVVMIVGLILLQSGKGDLKAKNLKLSRTMHSLRRDGQVVKEHLS